MARTRGAAPPAATADQVERAVALLVDAFADDPVVGWLFPDPVDRGPAAARVFRHETQASAAAGELQQAADGSAVAVWLPVDAAPVGGPEGELSAELAPYAERLHAFGRMVIERRPTGTAYLHLAFVGVAPDRRGAGLGGALLRGRLARADEQGMPAYLEASSVRNRALYQRLGFGPLGEPMSLPGGPPVWPMWREARQPTTSTTTTKGRSA